jgi:hypothetical protein
MSEVSNRRSVPDLIVYAALAGAGLYCLYVAVMIAWSLK